MAHLPSFEEILTEVHSRLGLKALANKRRFIGYELEVDGHVDRTQQLLQEIFDALVLDDRAQRDAALLIGKLSGILKALELRTWTGNASQQQVLWHLLACLHVPMWARNLACWSLANVEHDLPPIDAGMPGGDFWFLPTGNAETGDIKLPVPKVLGWLLELLNGLPVEKLRDAIGNKRLREMEGGNETVVRTLRNWQAGGLPKSDNKVAEVFPDDATLIFEGAFLLDSELSPEMQFEKALEFVVHCKKLNVAQLSNQIPMKPARLRPIFERTASEDEKAAFVRHVSIRYAAPSMAIIRQRLRVARLAQAGYQDLVKFLCPELKPEVEHDPRHNKVLQLIALFETIYNKTIQAWHHGNTEAEQDAWFEQQFTPWDCYDLLLPILSSIEWEDRVSTLSKRLTRRFLSLESEKELEDILPVSESELETVLRLRIERIQREFDENKKIEKLRQRVKVASPYRALQAEDSFWVLSQFTQSEGLNEKIGQMALKRMTEIAVSPLERGSVRLLELGQLLNGETRIWPQDVCAKVQQQLDAAEVDEAAWEQWKAPMLRFKAKHALFENRLDAAEKLFKEALAACSERAFGGLRGEIAREGFAVAIVRSALNRKNHEPYYRNMLYFMEFQNGVPSFEDTATECEEYYWSTLYRPYPGLKAPEGGSRINSLAAFKEMFELIEKADWEGFKEWLGINEKTFRNSDLKDARRSSVLMLWLKLLYEFEDKLPMLRVKAPPEFLVGFAMFERSIRNQRESIRILLDAWPEQAKIVDFKGQTPVMMAANHGDVEMVSLLVPLSEIDAQDYLGRTPLHAAVAGRSFVCLQEVLKSSPDFLKVTQGEGNTVAHTAVRFGWVEGLSLILDETPGLIFAKNNQGQTLAEMARELLENYDAWRTFVQERKGRDLGTRRDFETIYALLEERCHQFA